MQTHLPLTLLNTTDGQRADEILRRCVHCGFCNATCPTYQLLGDELDGPRGRIYLIKGMLETEKVDRVSAKHLDRCLTCRACETTCPSGVEYGELIEIGRTYAAGKLSLPWFIALLLKIIPQPKTLRRMMTLGRFFRLLLPSKIGNLLRNKPKAENKVDVSAVNDASIILLKGCVQGVVTPEVNEHLIQVLAERNVEIRFSDSEQCCGALELHTGSIETAKARMRSNVEKIDSIEVETIVSTASGCGVTLKEYGRLLGDEASNTFARKVVDVSEFLSDYQFNKRDDVATVAWHAPCSLQHGQKITSNVEKILSDTGYELVTLKESHLCCGSAGAYSLTQPGISNALRDRKIANLTEKSPDVIVTANIGCQMHIGGGTDTPVLHWLELLR